MALRLAQEQADREEIDKAFRNMKLSWEDWKTKARELELKKKRRNSELGEEGANPRKRIRKMRYSVLEKDWGEEESTEVEQGAMVQMGAEEDRTREPM